MNYSVKFFVMLTLATALSACGTQTVNGFEKLPTLQKIDVSKL